MAAEPLVQFFLSGIVLYVFYILFASQEELSVKALKRTVTLPQKVVQQHKNLPFDTQTVMELEKYKAILLQEAYFLQLYKQDKTIHTLLINKMEYILQNTPVAEPTEKQLYHFYKEHIDAYSQMKRIAFYIYKLPYTTKKDSAMLAERLNLLHIQPTDGTFLKTQTYDEVQEEYGTFFLHRLSGTFPKQWSVIQQNKNSVFFIYILQKDVAQPLEFQSIEDRVYKDFIYQKRLEYKQEAFEKIAKNYEIKVQ